MLIKLYRLLRALLSKGEYRKATLFKSVFWTQVHLVIWYKYLVSQGNLSVYSLGATVYSLNMTCMWIQHYK